MTARKPRLAGGVPVPPVSRNQPPVRSVSLPAPARTGQARTWRIEFPARQELLNANQRLHWAPKNRITQQIRSDAFLLARAAKIPPLDRIRVDAIYEPPDRRRRDAGNYYPTYKAAIDGLVDAGVVGDDDSKHVDGPFMRIADDPHPGGRIVLIVTELSEETSRG